MRTREVETDAKNLIRWEYVQSLLSSALEYAMDHLDELQTEGQIEDTEGTFVTLIDDWTIQASLFIGTVFSLTPSGKYYLPFACSNVDPCPRCKGNGTLKVFETCHICEGQGQRSIAELARARDTTETLARLFLKGKLPESLNATEDTFDCILCKGKGKFAKVCNWCEGLGSREAYLDQVWYETLDDKAGEYGLFAFSGEGDPCDLFVGMTEDSPID